MTTEKSIERKKLTIIEVRPVEDKTRTDGAKWQNLAFKAKDGDGERWYGCDKTDLFPYLVLGPLDADITTKEGERGTFRNVVMVYKDGQPVATKKSWPSRGKSPEEIASEENQTRAKIIAELWRSGKLIEMDPKVIWLLDWLEAKPTGAQPAKTEPAPARSSSDTTVPHKQDHIAGFERAFIVDGMKALKWDSTAFIKAYAEKYQVSHPSDKLPEFLAIRQTVRKE